MGAFSQQDLDSAKAQCSVATIHQAF